MQKTRAKQIITAERRRRAVEMRLEGKQYEAIGDELGISRQGAWKLVETHLTETAELTAEDGEKLRALELARTHKIEVEAWEAWRRGIGRKVTVTDKTGGKDGVEHKEVAEDLNGDPRYLSILLDCQARRSKLLGLDAAERHELTGKDGEAIQLSDAERTKRIEELIFGVLASATRDAKGE